MVKGKTQVWLTPYGDSPQELLERGGGDLVQHLQYSSSDMVPSGWFQVGEAEVSVTLFPQRAITASQVNVLQEELRSHRVRAQEKENALEEQIGKLLALSYEGGV